MHFLAQYKERPGTQEVRANFRPAHVEHRRALGSKMILAGPLLEDDGATRMGSFVVFEADSLEAAHTFAHGDPLVREGAFEVTGVTPLQIVAFNAPAKVGH